MEHKDIVAAVREAISNHPCRFDVDEKLVDQLVFMLDTIGEGNIQRGIQRIVRNHEWTAERRHRDDEYTKNHELVSNLREQSMAVGNQCRRGFIWFMLFLAAAALYLGVKWGIIKAV